MLVIIKQTENIKFIIIATITVLKKQNSKINSKIKIISIRNEILENTTKYCCNERFSELMSILSIQLSVSFSIQIENTAKMTMYWINTLIYSFFNFKFLNPKTQNLSPSLKLWISKFILISSFSDDLAEMISDSDLISNSSFYQALQKFILNSLILIKLIPNLQILIIINAN